MIANDYHLPRSSFGAKVAADPRLRLHVGTLLVEHRHDLWPEDAPDPDEIREHAVTMLDALADIFSIGPDGRPHRYVPVRLRWMISAVFADLNYM